MTPEIRPESFDTLKHLLRVGWRNFFPVVLLCQFLVLAGNRFWFYILLMYFSMEIDFDVNGGGGGSVPSVVFKQNSYFTYFMK